MRFTRLFTRTLREAPAEAETASHQLMLRAGMIRPLAAGIYAYLPLAWRSLRKIEQIVREEIDAAGGTELRMPALQPVELWQATGREAALGETLFHLRDRRERTLILGPTHEEVVTTLVAANVRSYRDLPVIPYQIQTKFRDEPRPRAGLMRVREFDMMDAYSFDVDDDGLDASYRAIFQAYKNIFARCGLEAIAVEADSGAIGGKDSQEFVVLAESGEDHILYCENGDYAANRERAQFVKAPNPPEAPLPLEEVHTPGQKTIEDLARFLDIPTSGTAKAVFYSADGELVFVVIRGDLEVNETKLQNLLKAHAVRLATDEEVRHAGLVAGSASPVGLRGIRVVADDAIPGAANLVAGANRPDWHLKNVNYGRDYTADLVGDIAAARAGDRCPRCGGELRMARGIENGHVFKLGRIYSEKLGALYLDAEGQQRPMLMGCYGIGMGRLLAAAIEQNHDDKGILFPASIAPYQVHLVGLNLDSPDVAAAADTLYQALLADGIEVLYDDRPDAAAGVKFNDADLIGLPLRLTVSPRTLKADAVELKPRAAAQSELVPRPDILARVRDQVPSPRGRGDGPSPPESPNAHP
jgi:prolyl-tRNA synthetase